MKDLGTMTLEELRDELNQEKAWLKECEMNADLAKAEIEHLEEIINQAEGEEK